MNYQLDFVTNFIKVYSKVFITIYIWSLVGFLKPNLELNSFFLPESAKFKSIVLILIGTFVFTILEYCFKNILFHTVAYLIIYRSLIFIMSFCSHLDTLIAEANSNAEMLLFIILCCPGALVAKEYKIELKLVLGTIVILDSISQITCLISNFLNQKDKKQTSYIVEKPENTSKIDYVEREKIISNFILDMFMALFSYTLFFLLFCQITGILSFLFVEHLSIWSLNFTPFFLLLCTFISARITFYHN